ncbi:MAG TPA: RluA family pseudouridine synthase [Desulfobacterales bacterium]|nr:RluA family pseudouridine synthase [Desulfobacterales bacterium]
MPVLSFTATESEAGNRLDAVIIAHLPTLSRSRASRLIRGGHVTVNGLIRKPGYLAKPGDVVRFETPSPEPITCSPEAIPISILYEDGEVIVLDKPPGLVVHPGGGHKTGTLVNALLFHCPDLERLGGGLRPGIVHRLDKDTSGILVVAKTDIAYESLTHQFKKREVHKRYLALVYGDMKTPAGVISLPIGRHPTDRKKMSTESRRSRSTETRWKIKERFSGVTLLEIDLKTGRTHQIRVHCAAMGHPVVGDATYGGKRRWKGLAQGPMQNLIKAIRRQMLHAWKLSFVHPRTGQCMHFESPLPEDMVSVLESLQSIGQKKVRLP